MSHVAGEVTISFHTTTAFEMKYPLRDSPINLSASVSPIKEAFHSVKVIPLAAPPSEMAEKGRLLPGFTPYQFFSQGLQICLDNLSKNTNCVIVQMYTVCAQNIRRRGSTVHPSLRELEQRTKKPCIHFMILHMFTM